MEGPLSYRGKVIGNTTGGYLAVRIEGHPDLDAISIPMFRLPSAVFYKKGEEIELTLGTESDGMGGEILVPKVIRKIQ